MSVTSKAIVAVEPRRVEMRELALPDPTPDQVVIRTEASGVSIGTEGWFLINARPEGQYPMTMGYQAAGIVESAGSNVSTLKEGQRVFFNGTALPEPYSANGWMSSHVSHAVVNAANCFRVPDGVGPEEASLAALASVSLVGIEMAQPIANETVAVIGLGLIGQMSCQWARLRGARVLAADRLAKRVELARKYSADEVINSSEEDFGDFVQSRTPKPGGFGTTGGADVVIDATGASIADVWVKALGFKGRMVLQGWYPEPVAFNQHSYHLRLASVHFPCGYTQPGIRAALDALGRGNLHIKPLISHTVPAQEAQAAYDMMLDTPGQVLGLVFTWGEQ